VSRTGLFGVRKPPETACQERRQWRQSKAYASENRSSRLGSLLWDCGADFKRQHGGWRLDGPTLRLEFSRISSSRFDERALKRLPPGSVYSERGVTHFARTSDEPVLVEIAGIGPTDTRYVDPASTPKPPARP
jgi:hypothetical protein